MKLSLFASLLIFICSFNLSAQTPCSGGMAGSYPCDGLTLQSFIQTSTFGNSSTAESQDSWGWTDPLNGDEYAIVALDNGTAFVDITNPTSPTYLGWLPTHTGSSLWRDVKVYNNHAYIVSDSNGNHGMQIFDLTALRSVAAPPVTFSRDGRVTWGTSGSNRGRAHNLIINEDTGYAYVMGVSPYISGGIVIYDLNTSLTSPTQVATYSTGGYCHDAQVVLYDGPDPDYQGKEILIGSFSGSDFVRILDVSNKSSITQISTIDYTNKFYTHQGWFTEDKRFFITGDEVDEENIGFNTRTLVFDLEDLDNPSLHYTHFGSTTAIDHNGYVRGNRFYLANYAAGMRVFNIEGLYDATPSMTEINYFDTYPSSNSASFNATWNVYPFFESGNMIVTGFGNVSVNGDGGLFVIKDPLYDNTDPTAICQNITATLDRLTGSVTIDATDVDNGSTDDFGIVSRTLSGQTTFTCDDVGNNFNVTLTVKDDYGNESSCVAVVTVAAETTAFTGATWTNGTPSIGSNAKISSDYSTGSDGGSIDACTCEVDNTRTLTIDAGDYLNITKDITVNGTLVVEHQGSVVQTDASATTINNGTINVNQTTPTLASRDFMVLGSPMSGETRESVWSSAFLVIGATTANFVPHPDVAIQFPGAENFADDNGDFWNPHSGALAPGAGYIVRPQTGYGQPGGIFNYTYDGGTLNNGNVDFTVVQNTPGPAPADNKNASPNVLSNPYPSAISADDLINANAMIEEVYFWEHLTPPSTTLPGANNMNFSMEDISMYNLSGGTAAASDPGTSTEPNGIISTGQGFGIKASAAGTATFTNAMRRTTGNTTLRFQDDKERIWLQVNNLEHGMQKQALIAFNSVASEGMDSGYDSRRLATVVSLYTHLGDGTEQLGIQTREAFDNSITIPVGFSTLIDAETEYKVSIGNIEGAQLSQSDVYLVDNLTGTIHDLRGDSYSFTSEMGTFNNRFTLQFTSGVLSTNDSLESSIIVYPNPANDLLSVLSTNSFINSVEVFDIRGRRMKQNIEKEKNTCSLDISRLETAVYFVKINTDAGSITKKIIKR